MLMPSELPNWLLFRALGARRIGKPDRSDHFFRLNVFARPAFHKLFHSAFGEAQLESHKVLTAYNYSDSCRPTYSSAAMPPSTSVSNLVQFLRKANISFPVGPLRCFEMMISALPCKSGSSCL